MVQVNRITIYAHEPLRDWLMLSPQQSVRMMRLVIRERPAKAFFGCREWNLKAALHLISHDAVDYFRIALCVDEELADTAVPR